MNRDDFIRLLGKSLDEFGRLVAGSLRSDIALLDQVNASLMENAGKQLRPMLLLLVAGASGEISSDSVHYAAAVEMLHNATLLHDDVADRSSTRRGQPTLCALMGPSAAVLVGDFWLSKAMDHVVNTKHKDGAIKLFSNTLSLLAEGEMLQLQKAERADTTEEDYLRIIYCKTASLFETACRVAAISVDAEPRLCEAAGRYGRALGMAFQIRDDIFDYTEGSEIGKPVGLDLKEHKITLPLLGTLRSCPDPDAIRGMVRDITNHPEYCDQLRDYVLGNGGIEYASSRLGDFISEALQALEAFSPSAHRDMLRTIANYNAIRTK